jgi:hypothetical protein
VRFCDSAINLQTLALGSLPMSDTRFAREKMAGRLGGLRVDYLKYFARPMF